MRVEFLNAINAVCKESNIDLRLSDIIDVSDYDTEIAMLVRNDQEMFEFRIAAVLYDDTIEMSIADVAGSPYSCDSFNASYFIKDKTLQSIDFIKGYPFSPFSFSLHLGPLAFKCVSFILK